MFPLSFLAFSDPRQALEDTHQMLWSFLIYNQKQNK